MSSKVVVSATHRYCAPAERVFDAWLTPWQASRFLFRSRAGTVMQCELQAEVGGAFTVIERRNAAEGDESVFNVVHSGRYVEITRPSRLVFDVSVLSFPDESTRVTVDVLATTPQTSEVVVKHELGDTRHAFAIQDSTRREWTNMLALLERELFPRRIGVHL
ncbi:MAG TPA: SRPBCC domain-containing protein [Ramlibacter sp.]|uniref:SRPBCC family protein n=1 Tax=Ramlibacter sp. TaxID=1917967 RepID=UPI002D7FF7DD|nr:SRPBCC domain-containing protein [Ramlibacter sp.]HET8746347.1 SRPBCC domain-containing protein [Ramlibacter sp.]